MKQRRLQMQLVGATFVGALVFSATAFSASFLIPNFSEVKEKFKSSDLWIQDRNGLPLQEVRIQNRIRVLEWEPLENLSPPLREAVILAEDRHFYSHGGVDWPAMAKAAFQNLFSKKSRGASTLSMQLVSLILPEPFKKNTRHRTLSQKLIQIQAAKALEATWSKKQILEAYLNLAPFRGELKGISAASRGLFGKSPRALNPNESLVLAALLPAPSAPLREIQNRACALNQRSCPELRSLAAEAFGHPYRIERTEQLAPHLAQRLRSQSELKADIRSTVDRSLQLKVTEALRKQVMTLSSRNVHDAAALVVDNSTGQVLAYVGSVGTLTTAREVDGITSRRQAGSTLKPFLYALAIQERYLTAGSTLLDIPTDIPVRSGVYRPLNYDREFHGKVPLRTALASSLNVPAVRTLNLLSGELFVRKLSDLGFDDLLTSQDYGMSLALGSADITLEELVNAYRTLANQGRWSPLNYTPHQTTLSLRHVFTPQSSFIISNILSDPAARRLTFGTSSTLNTRFWTAVKTGTSKDMRDNWCVGYSDHYTVGVWLGNFSGESMWNVSGVSGAAPAWIEIMNFLHENNPSRPPHPPQGVTSHSGEWYLAGTEPNPQTPTFRHHTIPQSFTKITYPTDGTIIAIDPDIPSDRQKVFFAADHSCLACKWQINGIPIGTVATPVAWAPSIAGDYRLEILDDNAHVLDSVNFNVRGSSAR